MVKTQLDITNSPFDPDQVLFISVELPIIVKYLIISIMDDTIYSILPTLRRFKINHCYFIISFLIIGLISGLLLSDMRNPSWQILMHMRYSGIKRGVAPKKNTLLHLEKSSALSNTQEIRDTFDQFQPIVGSSVLFT